MADLPPLPRLPGVPEAVQNELVEALKKLNPEQLSAFKELNRQKMAQQLRERKIESMYPDTGPLRRELYPKHMHFFAASAQHSPMPGCPPECDGSPHNEIGVIGANRSGKSMCMCYALVSHLTGTYPSWWPGRRWTRFVNAWLAGENAKAVRESIQPLLLGEPTAEGTGLIPKAAIHSTTARPGVPGAIDKIMVKCAHGGLSQLTLMGYDQGREAFQAAKLDIMCFDEEPPMGIYNEGLTRTLSTVPGEPNGLVMCAFTPLRGLSDVVLSYLPGGKPMDQGAMV